MLHQIPNIITVMRAGLVLPIVLSLAWGQYTFALVMFAIAGISDGVDGYLARRFDWGSRFGESMDPAADKILLAASAITLTVEGFFPPFLLLLLIIRDLMIVLGAGVFYLLAGPFQVMPSPWGKVSTFLQIMLVLMVIISLALPGSGFTDYAAPLNRIIDASYWLVAIVSLVSGYTYLWLWTVKLALDHRWQQATRHAL